MQEKSGANDLDLQQYNKPSKGILGEVLAFGVICAAEARILCERLRLHRLLLASADLDDVLSR